MHTILERRREGRRDQRGFTLVELLVVVLILGVLAAVVVFSVGGITNRGRNASCVTEVREVRTAIEAFKAQSPTNTNPANLHALVTAEPLGDGAERRRSPSGAAGYTYSAANGTYTGPRLPDRLIARLASLVEARNNVHRLRRSSPIDGEQGSAIIIALHRAHRHRRDHRRRRCRICARASRATTIATRPSRISSASADAAMQTAIAYLRAHPEVGRSLGLTCPASTLDRSRRRGNRHCRRLPAGGLAGPDEHPAGQVPDARREREPRPTSPPARPATSSSTATRSRTRPSPRTAPAGSSCTKVACGRARRARARSSSTPVTAPAEVQPRRRRARRSASTRRTRPRSRSSPRTASARARPASPRSGRARTRVAQLQTAIGACTTVWFKPGVFYLNFGNTVWNAAGPQDHRRHARRRAAARGAVPRRLQSRRTRERS